MDTTAKVSYEAKGKVWSDIVAHVDRLHKAGHYRNTNIDLKKTAELDRTGFKRIGYIHNAKLDDEAYFMPYILLQNVRKKSTGHKDEVYKSVHDYFRQRGYFNQRNSLFQISNMDDRRKYFRILNQKGLNNKQIRLIEARSLVDDVYEYERISCQSVGAYSVNVGEKGGAHIHFQNLSYPPRAKAGKLINLMPRGKKWKRKLKRRLIQIFGLNHKDAEAIIKSGKLLVHKPIASFNNTWKLEFPFAKNKNGEFDSRKALHYAHDKYDPMVINNFNKELKRAGVKGFQLHLIRTHNINHKDYPQWLKSKVANDKLQAANVSLNANNKGLRANQTDITNSFASDALSDIQPNITLAIKSGSKSASASASAFISSTTSSINASNARWQTSMTKSAVSASMSIRNKNKRLAVKRNSISIQQSNLDSELKRHKNLSNQNYDLSAKITQKQSTLSTLNSKIKDAKTDLKTGYHHIIYDLLDDVLPSNDPKFNFCKATNNKDKSKHGFSSQTLKEFASGSSQLQIGNNLYSGIGAVLHIISYDIWHTVNINGINKAKQDTRYKIKSKADFENRQIKARAKDDGKTWPD